MLRIMLALLLAAGLFSCLFSVLLPSSASLLAPTPTPTPAGTNTPGPTQTPTSTITPLPAHLITPNVTQFATYTVYWSRSLWESAAGENFVIEDFENDRNDYGNLGLPYLTGNRFWLTGKSFAEIINSPQLLETGNLLHFRDWEQGLTLTFPNDIAVTAFGFDYTSPEVWVLTINNFEITIPSRRNRFVGIIVHQDFPKEFTFSSSAYAQGGLSVDNISYIP